jgi:hypothetical protein
MENSKFAMVHEFFQDKQEKVMLLHMSEMGNHNKTFVVTSGIIAFVNFYENNENKKDGFQIQLKDRNKEYYSGIENFFGNFDFDAFEIQEKSFSDTLRIQYKDGSYFIIEVRI